MKLIFSITGIAIIFSIVMGCATSDKNTNSRLTPRNEVESLVEDYSDESQKYDGFENILQVAGTLLNSKVKPAVLDQKARVYEWNDEQLEQERKTMQTDLGKKTEIFLSFFTPNKKQDDLNKTKSLWKIFLDAGGRRYEGTATRLNSQVGEMRVYYPYHNRWSTPYMISFNVPTSEIENTEAKLTLTGPVGSTTLTFKKLE